MIIEVVQQGSPILTTRTQSVTEFGDVKEFYQDLVDTIMHLKTTHNFTRGVGLSAPQIGVSISMSVAYYANREYVLINPEIIEHSKDKTPIREGCISFFKFRGSVPRFTYVKVRAYDLDGKEYAIQANDDFAMLLQHEIDHLNGILYIQHLPNGEKDLYLA